MADTNYDDIVAQAYETIGRSGVGTAVSNIDQEGKDYWTGQLASGALTPENFKSAFDNAVQVYKETLPDSPYTQYVNSYQAQQAPSSGGIASLMTLQNAANAVNAPSSNNYFTANPDVAAAYNPSSGLTPQQFAEQHQRDRDWET